MSHPKILTLPRGLPTTWTQTESIVFDSMRISANNFKKEHLLFASASNWGPSKLSNFKLFLSN
jgi:hypothetical protein